MDGVHANALRAELADQNLHQACYTVFAGRVGAEIADTLQPGERTDDGDGSAASGRKQMRHPDLDRLRAP
jgi:hypothetical protein